MNTKLTYTLGWGLFFFGTLGGAAYGTMQVFIRMLELAETCSTKVFCPLPCHNRENTLMKSAKRYGAEATDAASPGSFVSINL